MLTIHNMPNYLGPTYYYVCTAPYGSDALPLTSTSNESTVSSKVILISLILGMMIIHNLPSLRSDSNACHLLCNDFQEESVGNVFILQ